MIIRQLVTEEKALYLTFDDGPCPNQTPSVLELLNKHQAQATFFLVGKKAEKNLKIAEDILKHNHAIGNHSLDHQYQIFFRPQKQMSQWILDSENLFDQLGLSQRAGFRPPNGIVTPKLKHSLKMLNLNLILWNQRYYDSLWGWSLSAAKRAARNTQPGDILLLHDVQKQKYFKEFLNSLDFYIQELSKQGFLFKALPAKNK